ncbi:MAG: DUF2157 domain-containing protein [Colwellia sp.]|nr:DUF2157 domain-containing protein [Colwellia sp.]
MESFRGELVNLIEHNAVDQNNIDAAVDISNIMPSQRAWLTFTNNLFLWIGCIALGFSFIYFLAHNWSQIGRFAKFALVEIALVLSILVYLKTQIGSVYSSAALTFATILLGALMALFGQTYQTGADPWQLFFNWALLMTPWALISRFTTIWLVWLGLLNLSIIFYCDVHTNPLSLLFGSSVSVLWSLFAFNSLSLAAWDKLSQSWLWMQKQWGIRIIALGVGISITSLALIAILDNSVTDTLALPVWLLFLVTFYLFYRKLRVDLFMLAGGCLSGIVVIVTLLAKEMLHESEPAAYFLLSVIVIALGVGAAFWLKKVQAEAQICQL